MSDSKPIPPTEAPGPASQISATPGALSISPEARTAVIAPIVRRYRGATLQRKQIDATQDALKLELKPLLNDFEYKDDFGFAKIVPASSPSPSVSSENADKLLTLATSWSKSSIPDLAEAGRSVLALVELKPRAAYVLIK